MKLVWVVLTILFLLFLLLLAKGVQSMGAVWVEPSALGVAGAGFLALFLARRMRPKGE
jgi:Flp pilus assembly protein protease CpaA